MKRTILSWLLVGVCAGSGGFAWALPRFSLQKGEGCALCHANPSGQGLRNTYGADVFGPNELAASRREALAAAVTKSIRLGGDFRSQTYWYGDQIDDNLAESYGFFNMQADLYASWQLAKHLSVYVEQDALRGTREAFVLFDPKGHEGYVKTGAFLPNYGLRVDDHTAYIRGGNPRSARFDPPQKDGLPWTPNYSDSGVELGLELAEIEWTFGAYNGHNENLPTPRPDADNNKAFLARGETYVKLNDLRLMLGGNVYSNQNADLNQRALLAGGFAGLAGKSWSVMGEVDVADNYLASASDPTVGASSLAVYTEATVKLQQGYYAVARHEFFDPDMDAAGENIWRTAIGAEVYPLPYLELKPMFRIANQSADPETTYEAIFQVHAWF